jgi:hypothetical protein
MEQLALRQRLPSRQPVSPSAEEDLFEPVSIQNSLSARPLTGQASDMLFSPSNVSPPTMIAVLFKEDYVLVYV